jgi:PEP-CTERM motif
MKFQAIVKSSRLATAALALFLGLGAVNAQAQIIDLSGAAEGGVFSVETGNGPSIYTALGFQFATVNTALGQDPHFHVDYFGAGTVIMHDNSPDNPDFWTLTKVDNGSFNAISFTAIGDGLLWSTNLNGSWISAADGLNVINQAGVNSLNFKLAVPGSCCSIGMDAFNVSTVTAVPEPETFAIMLAGLGLVGTIARRRKAKMLA